MRKILYSAVLVGTVLVGGILAFTIWRASPQTAEQYFESGRKYQAEGKHQEASIQFLNAVAMDPRHREARLQLAAAYMQQGMGSEAGRELAALLEYYPGDIPGSLQLGNLYLAAAQRNPDLYDKAETVAEEILAKEAHNTDALILWANALAGQQDLAAAEEKLRKVLEIDTDNLTAYVNLGNLKIKQNRLADAEKILLQARALDPRHRYVLTSLVTLYVSQKMTDKADAILNDLLEFYPNDRGIYTEIVRTYARLGRAEVAERLLAIAQQKSPADPGPSLELVDLYFGTNRPDEARRLLLDLKSRFPESLPVAKKVARTFMQLEPQRSRGEIEQILKSDDRDAEGYLLQGALEFQDGKHEQAKASIERARSLNGNPAEIHFFLGQIAANVDDAKAEAEFTQAVQANQSHVPARFALASVLMRRGRWADARLELNRTLQLEPSHLDARRLLAGVDVAQGDLPAAEKRLRTLLTEYPDSPAIHHQLGLLYARKNMTGAAETHLQKAFELEPENIVFLSSLFEFHIEQRQAQKAILAIDSKITDAGKSAAHYELLAQAYTSLQKFQDAETALLEAIQRDPSRSSAYSALGQLYLKTGSLDKIPRRMDDLLKVNPRSAFAHVLKGYALQLQGRSGEAIQEYSRALEIEPNNVFAANNLAYRLAEQNQDLTNALKWAQTARRLDPESGEIADTLGWVFYKQGNYVLARDQLRFAAEKLPENEVVWYHLGVATLKANQPREAEVALKRALATNRDFKEKSLAQVALAELQNKSRQSIPVNR